MSTPVRPKSYKTRIEKPCRSSTIKRPSGDRKKCTSPKVRHNPIARNAPKDVLNAPKAKRVRQSRLFSADSSLCEKQTIPFFGDRLGPHALNRLPVPRLYFENDDFMEMYADDRDPADLSRDNHHDSMTFLTQCFTDTFHSLLSEPPLPDPNTCSTTPPASHPPTKTACFREMCTDKES